MSGRDRLTIFGWAAYDFANTIFSMNIISLYFSQWVIVDQGKEDIWYSAAYSLSMVFVAVTMPILGAVSDHARKKLPFLFWWTLACCLLTLLIGWVSRRPGPGNGTVLLALGLFVLANYFYEGGNVFYNSLLPFISTSTNIGKISGIGVALGYVGSIAGMLLVRPFVEGKVHLGHLFGQPERGRAASFFPTAVFFFLFALPIFFFVREKAGRAVRLSRLYILAAFRKVKNGLVDSRKYPGVVRFLVADFLFEDAIATTIVYMAVYLEKVVGLPDVKKTIFLSVATLCAVGGSFLCGLIVDRIGPKRTLRFVVFGWIVSLLLIAISRNLTVLWILAGAIGIFLGSTWTSARPLLASLVPAKRVGQFFGLYALSGRAAAILGPLVWGFCVLYFKVDSAIVQAMISGLERLGVTFSPQVLPSIQYRIAIVALAMLMAVGLILFRKVPDRFQKRVKLSVEPHQ